MGKTTTALSRRSVQGWPTDQKAAAAIAPAATPATRAARRMDCTRALISEVGPAPQCRYCQRASTPLAGVAAPARRRAAPVAVHVQSNVVLSHRLSPSLEFLAFRFDAVALINGGGRPRDDRGGVRGRARV